MRWNDSKKWYMVQEADVMEMLNKFYLPEDREQALRNAKEGGMYLYSKHCHYMWLTESLFDDELPWNNELVDKGAYNEGYRP